MAVQYYTVSEHEAGQRIDNFLLRFFKNVPKSVIYRIIRKGEVRVEKKRIKPDYKLQLGESIRIPPVRVEADERADTTHQASARLLSQVEQAIHLEDEQLIVMNKPSGLAVHGGSGHEFGLIELFRQLRPNLPFVELVHRIDRDTSGLVLLAKSRETLMHLHELLRTGKVDKRYQVLVAGCWQGGKRQVSHILQRRNGQQGGQKMTVSTSDNDTNGQEAISIFSPLSVMQDCSLLEAHILTGRMHQIRVQLAHLRHPVLGDERYGDFALNRQARSQYGLKRLFLHAGAMNFMLPHTGQRYALDIPLPDDLAAVLTGLKHG